jgi:hypothetical protein
VKRLSFLAALLLGMVVLVACPQSSVTGPLAAPGDLQATPGSGEIVLTWQDNSTAEDGFRIYRKLEADLEFSSEFIDTTLPDTETYTDVSVSSADSYVYQVRAFAGETEGELSPASNAAKPTLADNKATLTVLRAGGGQGVVKSDPSGINCINRSGENPGACSFDFDKGTTVILTANPDEDKGSVFTSFGGACTVTGARCELVMDTAKEVTATFAEAQPGITVQLSGDSGSGRVVDFTTSDVGGPYINCAGTGPDCSEADYFKIGNDVVLYAEPSGGSLFVAWEGCDRVGNDTRPGRGTLNGRCDFKAKAVTVISAKFLRDLPDPTVTLTANPTVVSPIGTSITLEWNVDDKGSSEPFTLELTDNQGNNYSDRITDTETGSVVVPVSSSRLFTIKVTNFFGTGEDTAAVTQGDAPEITTFEADDADITAAASTTLRWTVTDATTVTLTGGGLNKTVAATGTEPVSPDATTTYTLTASKTGFSSDTATEQIEVGAAPVITFGASPTSVTLGGSSSLTWSITGEPSSVILSGGEFGAGVAAGISPRTATPTAAGDTVYTLAASNRFGAATSVTATVTATGVSIPAPVITSFTTPDTTLITGNTATFNWTITGQDTLTSLALSENTTAIPITPPTTAPSTTRTAIAATYSLRADNSGGFDVTDGIPAGSPSTITILIGSPPATTITGVTPGSVAGEYTIAWTQGGTGPVSYVLTGPATATIPAIPDGAPSVTITGAAPGEIYTLTATNQYGVSADALGTDSDPATIPAPPIPPSPIISFTPLGSPEDLSYAVGTAHTLNWSVQNGPLNSLTLDGGGLDVTATSAPVTLPTTAVTTTYTLEARNANPTSGIATKSIDTGLPPATEIGNILVGIVPGTYTIEWIQEGTSPVSYTITGPATATIPAIPDDAPSVTIEDANSGEEYTLTATNQYGTAINALATDVDTAKIP